MAEAERMTCPRRGCGADVAVVRVQGGGARRTSQGRVVPAARLPRPHYIPGTKDWCPQGEQSRKKPRRSAYLDRMDHDRGNGG